MSKWDRFPTFHFGSRAPLHDTVPGPGPTQAIAVPQLRVSRTAVVYACVAASIIIALIPALFFSYGYHHDFNAWGYNSHTCCDQHPETRVLLAVGRYFASIAENLQFF